MATKKAPAKPSTAVAVKKASSTAITNIQDMLRKQAEANASRVTVGSGKAIRVGQDKTFTMPDGSKTRDPIRLVVVDFVSRNEYYPGAFNKDEITPPTCFAIHPDPKKLAPSPNSPEIQSDSDCAACPQNVWGSSPTGSGKACKNTRLLAVLPPDGDAETEMWTLKVSPTALKSFDGFVAGVNRTLQLPPVGVIVEVSFSDAVTYPSLEFTVADEPFNPNVEVHFGRQDEARKILMAEPDVSSYGQEKPGKPMAKAKPKVAVRKPGVR